MNNTLINIKTLIGETTEYDKKEMLETKKPKSWLKSVSAFANGIGGILVFGISDDDRIMGVENPENDAEIISEQIKSKLDPIPEINLSFHEEEGKKLILLQVYPGKETPYYYIGDSSRLAFVRIGNESVPADRAALKRLVLKGCGTSFDSLPSQYKFKNMAFSKIRSVCKQRTRIDFEDSDYESWGLINDEGELTNAGALLADESPIRYSRIFCTRWNGMDKASGLIDAIDDIELSGGLINMLQQAVEFVQKHSRKAWMKTPDGRIEMPDYPERAVLEAIVNALIHRDYLEYGSEVHIDIFDDRIEIYSPGGMFDGTRVQDIDLRNVPSRRRNPIIADIFNRLKYMDRRGSGFKKILDDYKYYEANGKGLVPQFRSERSSFFITLWNLNYHVVKDGTKKQSDPEVIQSDPEVIQSDPEVIQSNIDRLIELIKSNPSISRAQLAQLLQLSERQTRKIMDQLRKKGKLVRKGSDYNGKWIII